MMKSCKKPILLLLVTVLCFVILLPGCSKMKDNNTIETLESEKLKEATLTFYFNGSENPEARRVLDEVEKETSSSLNIRLNFKWIPWAEFESKINSLNLLLGKVNIVLTVLFLYSLAKTKPVIIENMHGAK